MSSNCNLNREILRHVACGVFYFPEMETDTENVTLSEQVFMSVAKDLNRLQNVPFFHFFLFTFCFVFFSLFLCWRGEWFSSSRFRWYNGFSVTMLLKIETFVGKYGVILANSNYVQPPFYINRLIKWPFRILRKDSKRLWNKMWSLPCFHLSLAWILWMG